MSTAAETYDLDLPGLIPAQFWAAFILLACIWLVVALITLFVGNRRRRF